MNQEIVTIRKKHPGEYIVNIYFYDAFSKQPLSVKIRIDQVNPTFKTVYRDELSLSGVDDEQTAVRFSVDEQGNAHGFNQLPVRLTPMPWSTHQHGQTSIVLALCSASIAVGNDVVR